jgi:hypothetical protein
MILNISKLDKLQFVINLNSTVSRWVIRAMYIWEYTALGLVPTNLFIFRYCFTHRKNNSMFHLSLYISVISSVFKSKRLVKNWMISSLSFIKVISLKSPFTSFPAFGGILLACRTQCWSLFL